METVNKIDFITSVCKGKFVLDLGCICHSSEVSTKDPNWLHGHIVKVAKYTVGVDYASEEVEKLNRVGYNIICADVTKPLPLKEGFDVIVAGDLIEHLTNFDGFFENINRLLKDDGVLIITTPNPFYRDGFFHAVFKNKVLVNPEHTCWIDPQCMRQLIGRYPLEIVKMYWISERWELKNLITNDKYNIFKGRWEDETVPAKIKRKVIGLLFELIYLPAKAISSNSVKYADYLVVVRKRGSALRGGHRT